MTLTGSDKRTWVKGLLAECPFGVALPDCQFKNLRKMSLIDSVRTVNEMPDQDIDALILYHCNCIEARGRLEKNL